MSLILAKNKVNMEELAKVVTPERTDTHTPIPHAMLVERTHQALDRAGLEVTQEEHALGRGGLRYFGGFALKGRTWNQATVSWCLGFATRMTSRSPLQCASAIRCWFAKTFASLLM